LLFVFIKDIILSMKLSKSQLSIGILFFSLSVAGILFAFSKLTPSASPSSTFHSLNDIYTLITTGTEKATPNSTLTTSSSPTATTSHSTTEIYLLLANKFKQENLRPSTNIFGITGTYGTPDANYVLATSSAVSSSLTPTYTTDTLPTYTLNDIYNLINDTGTRLTTPNHTFSSSPSASMYTTTQIYERLASLKTSLTSNKYGTTTSIFGVTGTFEPVAQLNEGCSSNDECYTGWCDDWWSGSCTSGAIGDSCGHGESCSTGYCDPMLTYTCTDGSVGSGCDSDDDCVSGKCAYDEANGYFYECTAGAQGSVCYNNADCSSPNICDTGTNTCVDGSNGAACTSSLGCSSGHCYGDICTAGITDTDMCDSPDDCESGFCNTVDNLCSSGAPGSNCFENSECDTYNCNVETQKCSADLPAPTVGLVGYWPFNETSGTTASDLSGNSNNGTITNGVLVNQNGKVGKAFRFDGVNDYVNMGDKQSLELSAGGSITYCAWFNTTSPDNYVGDVFSKDLINSPYSGYSLYVPYGPANNGSVLASIGAPCCGSGGGGAGEHSTSDLNDGSWHYACGVVNQLQTVSLYVDGIFKETASLVGGTPSQESTQPFMIGARWTGTALNPINEFNGLIDEVAVWNRVLAPAEITALYNNGAGMSIVTP
jgi:hypothetical protein